MSEEDCVIRVRGLPWSVTEEELLSFFSGCEVKGGTSGIHFTYIRDGRPSGEAYLEMETKEDVKQALEKDQQNLGKRYIEVFESKQSEMDWVVKRSGSTSNNNMDNQDAVVRLRGLPFGCSKEEIAHFFTGLEIVPNGITLLQDGQGRSTGDGYVQFASQDIAERALAKHKEKIGHRYIEIFKSSLQESSHAHMPRGGGRGGMGGRPGPYDRMERFGGMGGGGGGGMGGGYGRGRGRGNIKGFYDDICDDYGLDYQAPYPSRGGGGGGNRPLRRGGLSALAAGQGYNNYRDGGSRGEKRGPGADYMSSTGHHVHMRGLPFAAVESDIHMFFKPVNPVHIVIHQHSDGRASGEADVEFATYNEAKEAMKKNKETMHHRYIELFIHSTPAPSLMPSRDYPSGPMGGGMSSMSEDYGPSYANDNFNNYRRHGGNPYNEGYGANFGGY